MLISILDKSKSLNCLQLSYFSMSPAHSHLTLPKSILPLLHLILHGDLIFYFLSTIYVLVPSFEISISILIIPLFSGFSPS